MSKKKRKAVAAPPPAPDAGFLVPAGTVRDFAVSMTTAGDLAPAFARLFFGHADPKPTVTLADAMAEQVAGLTADFDGTAQVELPKPERDLSGYRDAFASAAANCDHDDAVELLYGREWVCDACGRMLTRDDMRRARAGRSIWDLFR